MSAAKRMINGNLKKNLIDLIKLRGSLSVAEYMKIVLTNPASGFYMNDDVFGVKGHFITNPEISQIFGELIGAWILQEWRRFGCPKPLRLIEFGPGRGTLIADIARTVNKLDRTPNSIQLRLIEVSSKLRDVQRETLEKQNNDLINRTEWFSHIDSMKDEDTKDGFSAFISHEFLDALPIHKFIREPRTKKWRELLVDYNQNQELRFCIATQPTLSARLLIPENFVGDHIEVCPEAALCLEKVTKRLNSSQNGCMLVCDYGFEDKLTEGNSIDESVTGTQTRPNRDTFRAFKNHQIYPPLKDPGEADLTADVDFSYLKNHLRDKAITFGPVNQRDFLLKCGLKSRLEVLLNKASREESDDLESGAELMINDMGQRYKFLAIFPKGSEHLFENDPPAGFSDID